MFARIVHCDWSKHPGGRWRASARRTGTGWQASGPSPVGDLDAFVDALVELGRAEPALAAFDFPIGLPKAYGAATGFPDFLAALDAFGGVGWEGWFEPAGTPAEIGARRPFYPAKPGAARVRHMLEGLGVASVSELTRRCERGGNGVPAAGCMFWLVGAKTVGKAAIHGWQAVIRPALARGARLWPFEGDLAALAGRGGLVLAESYPGDAYGQIGLTVRGKGDPVVLLRLAPAVLDAAETLRVGLSPELRADIRSGFAGRGRRCGDAFDAVIGLLAAVAVADGARDGAPCSDGVRIWEGWILGRQTAAGIPDAAGAFRAGGEI